MDSYIQTLAEYMSKEQLQLVKDLFDWLMQPCLGLFIFVCILLFGHLTRSVCLT